MRGFFVGQIVAIDASFGQQRRLPQRTAGILRAQKFVLPDSRSERLLLFQLAALLGEQFSDSKDRVRRMPIARIVVIDRAECIQNMGVAELGVRAGGLSFKGDASSVGLVPRRRLCGWFRRVIWRSGVGGEAQERCGADTAAKRDAGSLERHHTSPSLRGQGVGERGISGVVSGKTTPPGCPISNSSIV